MALSSNDKEMKRSMCFQQNGYGQFKFRDMELNKDAAAIARTILSLLLFALCGCSASRIAAVADKDKEAVIDIGSERQLMIDNYMVSRLNGTASLKFHHPEPREIVMSHDAPWEGSGSAYHSIFKDGNTYKMYYKAWQLTITEQGKLHTDHPLYTCYAESDDGIVWRKPNLGLFEFQGSRDNNIVIAESDFPGVKGKVHVSSLMAGHPAVFLDENPAAPKAAKYKAFLPNFYGENKGLLAFGSADGIHWKALADTPVIREGIFDSQNLAFWDSAHQTYRAYWRVSAKGVRSIRTAISRDFIHWENQENLDFGDAPTEHLYTSQIKPYYRAPQLLIGFPARYTVRGWSPSMGFLPDAEHRMERTISSERHGTVITESLLMTSRDGVSFNRRSEAFLRPGIERSGAWAYGNQYLSWGIAETKSPYGDGPGELSFYSTESYWTDKSSLLRRYALRIDGFGSVNAAMEGGELVTKPIRFHGDTLRLNFSTSAAGSMRIELLDEHGSPLEGFTANDCEEIFGDTIDRPVIWKGNKNLGAMAGKPIRVRFLLKDADLFSFRFQ